MEENKDSRKDLDTGDSYERSVKGRAENFFYHYKWHSIAALILVFAIVICSVQMCQKESFDVYIMYAGSHEVQKVSKDGALSEYATIMSSLKEVTDDFDGDGTKSIALDTLYMLSEKERKEIEAELAEKNAKEGTDYTLSYSQLSQNNEIFRDRMLYSEYYLCLLSEGIYNTYKSVDGVMRFMPLASYAESPGQLRFAEGSEGTAVYLKSTGLAKLPAFAALPDDTVIVLRARSEVSSHFGKDDNNEIYKRSEEVLRKMLNYQ